MAARTSPTKPQQVALEQILADRPGASLHAFHFDDEDCYVATVDDPADEFEYLVAYIYPDGSWDA